MKQNSYLLSNPRAIHWKFKKKKKKELLVPKKKKPQQTKTNSIKFLPLVLIVALTV